MAEPPLAATAALPPTLAAQVLGQATADSLTARELEGIGKARTGMQPLWLAGLGALAATAIGAFLLLGSGKQPTTQPTTNVFHHAFNVNATMISGGVQVSSRISQIYSLDQ